MNICTQHALTRMQQRGVSWSMVQHVLDFGKELYHLGGQVFWISKSCVKKMIRKGVNPQHASKCLNVYVVCSSGKILTVAHKTRNFKK